jgi:hypothetical protein
MSASMAVGYIVGALAVESVARALHGALIARGPARGRSRPR